MEKYPASDFSYPLSEDIAAVYAAKDVYEKSNTKMNYWHFKNAIWNVSLTLKGYKSTGELSAESCDKLNDYFWKLLLDEE